MPQAFAQMDASHAPHRRAWSAKSGTWNCAGGTGRGLEKLDGDRPENLQNHPKNSGGQLNGDAVADCAESHCKETTYRWLPELCWDTSEEVRLNHASRTASPGLTMETG